MRKIQVLLLGCAAAGALCVGASSPARADWRWHHGPGGGWVRFWAPGVVVASPPVYYAPPPAVVYAAPPPVYYAPPPVVYGPPVVSYAPAAYPVSAGLVRAVQTELNRLMYLRAPADGVMGRQTISAISEFERTHGLPVDGAATPFLLERLRETPAGY